MKNINFITLNIRSLNDLSKVHLLKDYLGAHGIDICFLQKTHIDSSDYVDELGNAFSEFFCFFTVNCDKTRGVGILIKKDISHNVNILNTQYDLNCRFLRIEKEIDKCTFNFLNIYSPNMENEQHEIICTKYMRRLRI